MSAFEGYAFDAGVRPGDRITAINGQPVSGASVDKVGWDGMIRDAVGWGGLEWDGVGLVWDGTA